MISGLNVGADDVQKLAALTRDLLIKLDLIDGNDPIGCILPDAIRATLRAKLAMPLARWYSGGAGYSRHMRHAGGRQRNMVVIGLLELVCKLARSEPSVLL